MYRFYSPSSGFFLKPCFICHYLLYRHRPSDFSLSTGFFKVGADSRLYLLFQKKNSSDPCLPCHYSITPVLTTHFLLCLSSPFHISAECRLASIPVAPLRLLLLQLSRLDNSVFSFWSFYYLPPL